MDINKLENACKWLQRNDKNGEYMDMIEEYHDDEIPLQVVYEVCKRSFTEIRDLHLNPEDVKEKARMDEWLEYIR